jgi:hypothetical protein
MRRLADGADNQRRSRQPVGGCYEFNLCTFVLEQDIGGIFSDRGDHIVALGKPVEQLDAGIECVRVLLGELLPEAHPIQLAQRIPLYELQTGSGNLAADRALPARVQNVLPSLRRVRGGDLG